MRKLSLLLFAVLATAFTVQAQQNIAKIGVGSIFNRTLNLEYERILTNKTTIFGEIGYQFPVDIPSAAVDFTEDAGSTNALTVTDGKYNNFYVALEYRIYTGGEAAKGFFVAPYLKISNYSVDVNGTYNNDNNGFVDVPAEVNLGYFATSIGGQLGYQWIIKDKVTINWSFVGLGVGFNRVSAGFTAQDNDVFEAWEQDVNDFLADFPGSYQLESDNAARTIDAAATVVLPAARASLSIGYMF
jgi:hypothetical protein